MEWKINLEIDRDDGLPYYDVMFESGYIYYGSHRIYIDDVDDATHTLIYLDRLGFMGVVIGKLWARWQTIKMAAGCPPYHHYWEYVKQCIEDMQS